ncbi:MAG: terminase large subunit domain-containing protein, partial [Methylocella sp.]
FWHPPLMGGNKIVSVIPIGLQPIVDFEVNDTHCYQAAGVIHHNSGKTFCGAAETAIHLTGLYPPWWRGVRFTGAVPAVIGSLDNLFLTDKAQRELFGDPSDDAALGTGLIPKRLIGSVTAKPGIPNAFQSARVMHTTGGWSEVQFKSYDQGWKKFMGIAFKVGWMDEEPELEIWTQFIRATIAQRDSVLMITFTPEQGVSIVVNQFMNDLKTGQALIGATWDDAPHLTAEMKKQRLEALPEHEREMRSRGVPLSTSGLVFPVAEEKIKFDPFEIPPYWTRLCAIDFGWTHPFAAVWGAHDRETDAIYIYDCYRESLVTPPIHAAALQSRGKWIPVAWPHDGLDTEKGSGKALVLQYRDLDVNLLRDRFSNPPDAGQKEGSGGNAVEPGIFEMLRRLQTGQLRVAAHLNAWFEEYRMYHRDRKGRIVDLHDDLMSASRYMVQSVRFAQTQQTPAVRYPQTQGLTNWS